MLLFATLHLSIYKKQSLAQELQKENAFFFLLGSYSQLYTNAKNKFN